MAITREEFFNKKANASLWDVAVSIKRGNPLPLDADSIFESYAALETYAADVLAYPGQLVAVVEEDATGIYYLDQNLASKPWCSRNQTFFRNPKSNRRRLCQRQCSRRHYLPFGIQDRHPQRQR